MAVSLISTGVQFPDASIQTTAAVALSVIYPVGSIYMNSSSATNPATLFGFGTWVQFGAGRMAMGVGGSFGIGATGGSNDSTLPSHTHTWSGTTSTIGNHTHNIQLNGQSGTYGGYITGSDVADEFTDSTDGAGSHSHTVSGTTAGAGSTPTNTNLPPYIVVYMWNRTA